MLTPESKAELEKQKYRIVGGHSAVKTCGWTKNMINGQGGCYKLKFYGIMSHQCMQMTTSISCANRCTFCWRGYKAPVSKEWKWEVDDPQKIFDDSIKAHHGLLVGFGGSEKSNKSLYQKSKDVRHVALSLTGEPIIYPKMNELLSLFNKNQISTFLVTNAQYPEHIRDLNRVTQLYLSVDAPTKELLKEIDLPLFSDYWERLNKSLGYLAQKKDRTCIRLTLIRKVNDVLPDKYAELIHKGSPDFIEVKSYMHVGLSRDRLKRENMPLHEEVVDFCKELAMFLPEYEIVSEHVPSRVVLFAKKIYKRKNNWYTWIDFKKWDGLVNSNTEFSAENFMFKTPKVGLSGTGTLEYVHPNLRKKIEEGREKELLADEHTDELELF